MSETTSPADVNEIRQLVSDAAVSTSYRQVADDIGGVSHALLHGFVTKNETPSEKKWRRIREWAEQRRGANGVNGNGRPPTAQELSEVDAVWLAEVRRIAALDEPESKKMLYRDSLSALMGRAWGVAAERAAEARARAVERGEEAAARRAEVLSSDQQEDAASRRAARRAAAGPPDRTTSDGETTTGTSESGDSPPTA